MAKETDFSAQAVGMTGSEHDGQSKDTEGDKAGSSKGCSTGYKVIMAVLVRGMLMLHAAAAVWLVVSLTSNTLLWCLLASNGLLVAEGIFSVVKRQGREARWVCPCFIAFLVAVLPPIWLVELNRLERFTDAVSDSSANLTSLTTINGLTVPIKLEADVWASVMEQTLLFLLVLCRWLLPRGDITRHELSQLLFVFVGIASDSMELFELFDETDVRQDPVLTYVILGIWSVSLSQFVLVLTATTNPRKIKVTTDLLGGDDNPWEDDDLKGKGLEGRRLVAVMFATDIWGLLFSVLVQDGPFAGVRIYALLTHNLLTYSIIFFICKNILVVCLVIYRLSITIYYMHKLSGEKEGDENKGEEEDGSSQNSLGSERGKKGLLGNRVTPRSIRVEPVPMSNLSKN